MKKKRHPIAAIVVLCAFRPRPRSQRRLRAGARRQDDESPTPPILRGSQGTPALTAADVDAGSTAIMPYALADRRHRRRRGRRGQGRPDPHRARLRLSPTSPSAAPVDPKLTLFRPGLGVEAVHLDRGHAAGRAGQDRSRRRRQQVPRLQDPAARRQADHHAQPHDAHGRASRSRPRTSSPRTRRASRSTTLLKQLDARRACSRPARRPPIRTMAPRSPATSCSACPASHSTTTSTSTSSRRSA